MYSTTISKEGWNYSPELFTTIVKHFWMIDLTIYGAIVLIIIA